MPFYFFYFPQKNLPTPALFQTGNGQIVFLFRYNILQPDTFLDKNESDDALDQVNFGAPPVVE